jgi:hypothetical protein
VRHNSPVADPQPDSISDKLLAACFVFVWKDGHRSSLTAAYYGPYRVLKRFPQVFELQLCSRVDSVSVHCLNPAKVPDDVVLACPPTRGRPQIPIGPLGLQDAPLH